VDVAPAVAVDAVAEEEDNKVVAVDVAPAVAVDAVAEEEDNKVAAVDVAPAVAVDAVAEEAKPTPVPVLHRRKASALLSETMCLTSAKWQQQTNTRCCWRMWLKRYTTRISRASQLRNNFSPVKTQKNDIFRTSCQDRAGRSTPYSRRISRTDLQLGTVISPRTVSKVYTFSTSSASRLCPRRLLPKGRRLFKRVVMGKVVEKRAIPKTSTRSGGRIKSVLNA
jgi:hypothetical protein